jgi:hypothetical protein
MEPCALVRKDSQSPNFYQPPERLQRKLRKENKYNHVEVSVFSPVDGHEWRRLWALWSKQQGWYWRDIAKVLESSEETVSRWLSRAHTSNPKHSWPGTLAITRSWNTSTSIYRSCYFLSFLYGMFSVFSEVKFF